MTEYKMIKGLFDRLYLEIFSGSVFYRDHDTESNTTIFKFVTKKSEKQILSFFDSKKIPYLINE